MGAIRTARHSAFFPGIESDAKRTVCISQCIFRNREAMDAAFAAPATKELIDDIHNFTNLPMNSAILTQMEG